MCLQHIPVSEVLKQQEARQSSRERAPMALDQDHVLARAILVPTAWMAGSVHPRTLLQRRFLAAMVGLVIIVRAVTFVFQHARLSLRLRLRMPIPHL